MDKWKIIILIFATPILFYLYIQTEFTIYSTTSPTGEYTVTVTQDRHPILLPEWRIYLYAENTSKSIIDRKQILSADWLEGSFKAYYPKYSWLDSNVLTIGQDRENLAGTMRITNEGKNTIKYLLIENEYDKFLIFDLKPKTSKTLRLSAENSLTVEWEVDGFSDIFGDGVSLVNHLDFPKDLYYEIKVNEQKIHFQIPGQEIETGGCCGYQRRDY